MRDVWETPECIVTVNYVNDGARVGFVLCSLRVPPSPGFDDARHVPDLDQLLAVLGRHMDDDSVRKARFNLRSDGDPGSGYPEIADGSNHSMASNSSTV